MATNDVLRLEGLTRSFGHNAPAVNQVDLRLEAGSLFCLLGPSGCGKSTLLRLVGGYLAPDAGRVFLADVDVNDMPLERRNIGMVFQNYALFPHLTARANVAFGLEARGVPRSERRQRVDAMLDRVGLSSTERERRPRELSGGQQQRVALARALVIQPKLLLLDEPLANLDRQLREQMRLELKEILRTTGVTALLVTHDQEEALSLADRVGVMLGGRLLQTDAPRVLYNHPRTPFVAGFLGLANLLRVADAVGDMLHLEGGLSLRGKGTKDNRVMIRPEKFLLGPAAERCPTRWTGRVINTLFLGAQQMLQVAVTPAVTVRACCRPGEAGDGDEVTLGIPDDAVWIVPGEDV
ncbi:ABC transporter ATP-binding protein [Zavarzinella formosa]|uniref:ABC transporter ATP-binding protein n=1 Tax=Zavarzinella formosa TaxID=360055 RepID=UPI0002FE37F2|nr:ABC transporter ATP-binding protein [Zavarzinella formosa]